MVMGLPAAPAAGLAAAAPGSEAGLPPQAKDGEGETNGRGRI